ncbi:HAD family hydrolase [Acinetobacter higginsii]|uniref:hypothetical protein n=1 Tax=Acinetobacter higginsii TaxID=70347 RepID=UPI001F4B07C6|nr:hypothetical protein [Acinetobacter higginsii]MCH7340647.1 hypothetical protein [Acinetobacter higginsii]
MKNIVDVCWTMYRSNTTFDFISFVIKKQKEFNFKFFLLNFFVTKVFLIVLGRILKKDCYRYFYISLLKGYHYDDLAKYVDQFYQEFLIGKKIEFTFNLLDGFVDKADVILCSASLDIIVEKVANNLGVEYFASHLAFKNNVCLGLLESDLLFSKHELFSDVEIDCVITDNLSDYNLVKRAKNSIILSNKKNVIFWEERNIHVNYIFEGE